MIKDTLKKINTDIKNICSSCMRSVDEITLVAVSKTHPVSALKEAYDCGIRDFGENKVQEMLEKHTQLPSDIRWHMIGHLQRNKVKSIVPFVYMIHSVDSLRLCQEIEKEANKIDRVIPILLEVNISNEDSKYGLSKNEVLPLVNEIETFNHIKLMGLMTIAPFTEDKTVIRNTFSDLRQLLLDIKQQKLDNNLMCHLSMGMSHDYDIALEEGATIIRVGSSIFGVRNYN